MERFRSMEQVGRMWQRQARLGMSELERAGGDREFTLRRASICGP
jgi:hypothetical protein